MKNNGIKVLLIESKEDDARRIERMIIAERSFSFAVTIAGRLEAALDILSRKGVDIILVNLVLPDSEPFKAFEKLKNAANGLPIIVLSDIPDDILASMAVGSGAQDFLTKERIDQNLIAHSIRYSIQRCHIYSQLEQRVHEFQAGEARLLNVIVNNADGILVVDTDGMVRFINPAAEVIFGRRAESFIGKKFEFSVRPEETHEFEIMRFGGDVAIVEMRVVETAWESSRAYLVSARDITLRKKAEKALRDSEERYALAIRGAREGVWDWDLSKKTIFYSREWKEMLGYSGDEVGNGFSEWYDRIHVEERERVKKAIDRHLKGETTVFEQEYRILHREGTYRWVFSRGSAVRDKNGAVNRFVGSQIDITARKHAEGALKKALDDLQFALASEKVLMEELDRKNRELMELSITDGLTRLFNHRFIQERFDFEFKRVKRYGGHLSCMMIDIDHFKEINDTYGHQFGDVVLREVASLLTRKSREVDICGRYGGEEFMVLSNQPIENAMKHATKIHAAIDAGEFLCNDKAVHVTVSIGLADYRNDIRTKQELIDRADTAMYDAKNAGRNLIRIWKEREREEDVPLDKYGIQTLKGRFVKLSEEVRATYMASTNALVKAVEAKDPHTQRHSERVAEFSVKLARQLRVPDEEVEIIKYAALLHDVGKIGVSQEVLVKNGALTDAEYELLKKHPVIGVNILKEIKFLERELPIILHHHERYDGAGYPHGLKGREIPLGAAILGVCDAFEAMTAGRTYKDRRTVREAMEELDKGKGTQFSPDVVDAFLMVLKEESGGQNDGLSGNGSPAVGVNV